MVNEKQIGLVIVGCLILGIGFSNWLNAQKEAAGSGVWVWDEEITKPNGDTYWKGHTEYTKEKPDGSTLLLTSLIAVGFFIGALAVGERKEG